MNLSFEQLARIAPWLRSQCDLAFDVLFRTREFFGEQGGFRQLTFYDGLGFAAFLAAAKSIIDMPIDVGLLRLDPFSPTYQAVVFILLMASATTLGIALFIASRLVRLRADVVTCMKSGYFLWAFVVVSETLLYPLRAGAERGKMLELASFDLGPDRFLELLRSASGTFWLFLLIAFVLFAWQMVRWTSALRALHAIATWRALIMVLLSVLIANYVQQTTLNPLGFTLEDRLAAAAS